MLTEMYKRRVKLAYGFLGFLLLFILAWLLFQTPETAGEWLEMLFFLFPIGLIFLVIFISRSQYNKVKDFQIPNSQKPLMDLDHMVIKKDATLIPRLLLFEKSGEFIGTVKPMNISWWMYPFIILEASFMQFFPLTYGFIANDGKTRFTFQKKGWLKQVRLTIFNEENKEIGTYIQEELKALFHIKGKLFDEKEELILSIKASGFSGSFSWNDEEGNRWAYFYSGMFPHEYTKLFRDMKNDIVELSDQLVEQDKIRLLAAIGYLFMRNEKQ